MKHLIYSESIVSPSSAFRISVVTYWSGDYKVKGYLIEPKKKAVYDGMVYLRGGIKKVGMVRIARIMQYANEGLVVFAPFYRGNEGGEGQEDFGGEDRQDAFAAYELLRSHPMVENQRVHVVGFSRGGIMAGLVAAEYNPTSMITWGGVSDCTLMYEERPDLRKMLRRSFSGDPKQSKGTYLARSPISLAEKISCPVLIIHGEIDEHVGVEHAYQLYNRLDNNENVKIDKWIISNRGHLLSVREQLTYTRNACDWMKNC
ncbi:alpha/beta hydrolase family protein [Salipaludibacillus daqingensis]|uniref:alpha/beta hydrolase family protein n=1 Tax=Salipaludibacillus daqingensis TaxID=3041001 RepID=UPI002474E25E|nr:prolyl oligopeptidase family serine peptidase [Salipaludibacillus daqingensis]